MDLRKIADMYIEIPLLIILLYYFYHKEKLTYFEKILYILLTITLFINIILSLEMVRVRYVSWNYFLTG